MKIYEVREWIDPIMMTRYYNPSCVISKNSLVFKNDLGILVFEEPNKFIFRFRDARDKKIEFVLFSIAKSEVITLFRHLEVCITSSNFHAKKGV